MDEIKKRKRPPQRRLTGEDIDMFREREQNRKRKNENNVCDDHIDGA